MFSRTCSTRLAPVITVETCGFFAHHASASCASVQPRSSAIALSRAHLARCVFSSVSESLQPLVARQRAAAALGDAVEVLAGQQTRRQRAPDREPEPDVVVEPRVLVLDALARRTGCTAAAPSPACAGDACRRCPTRRGSRRRSTPTCPSRAPCPLDTMSDIAHTVSSIGVFGSARWQKSRSTKSRPSRSSEPSIACIRYLRFSVFFMLGPSWMPQKSLVEIDVGVRAASRAWRSPRP